MQDRQNVRRRSPGRGRHYKLDTLRDVLGGTMTRAMLVSYQHLAPPKKRCR
jgi:hypothetical protein